MHTTPNCRQPEDLRRFLLGEVTASDAEQIQEHLAACPRCLDTVSQIQASDTLIEAMRDHVLAPAPAEADLIANLIARLSDRNSVSRTSAGDAISSGEPPLSGFQPTAAEHAFLAPSQAADEIGWVGGYRILKVLGIGGMGIVFEADDPQLHRRVALKAMKPELAARAADRQRFLREAQAMAAIEHDHIVTIHQVGEHRGVPFLAMQLLKGETLEDRLRRMEETTSPAGHPLQETLRIGREIAEGLAAAHAQGLTHRDIKPANIWLEKKSGRVKILDFGLARPLRDDAHLTQTGSIAGTPQYMSPEQAAGQPVDHLSDLFSLGCVVYRMATGVLPFTGAGTLAVLRALAVNQPSPPHEIKQDVPAALSALTMQLLAKPPQDRPQSAEAVVQAICQIERAQTAQADSTDQPRPVAAARGRGIAWIAALSLLLVGPLAFWYGPAVYRFATNQGVLVIQTDDPRVEVTVTQNGELVRIIDRLSGRQVTLTAGAYQLALSGGQEGLKLDSDQFTLSRGGREIVRVRREPAEPAKPVAVSPIPAPTESPTHPFVVLSRGEGAEGKFATLEEAISAAQSGDTIEIQGNVVRLENTTRIRGKALTIRAAAGFRPMFQLCTKAGVTNLTQLNSDAALILEGLEFQRVGFVPEKPVNYWCVASNGAPLRLVNCRFVIPTLPGWTAAVYFDRSPVGEIRQCQFVLGPRVGWCDWICPTGGRMLLEGNVVAGSESDFIMHQRDSELRDVSLSVVRNTLVNAPLNFCLDAPPPEFQENGGAAHQGAAPIRIEALGNVLKSSPGLQFVQAQAKYTPEAKVLTAPAEAEALLRRLIDWREDHNLYQPGFNFLSVGDHLGPLEPIRPRRTLAEWQEFWRLQDTSSLQGPIRFRREDVFPTPLQPIETLTAEDLRLHSQSAGVGAGEDGRDLGADVDLVGPGLAYERWKGTPAYQEWLKDAGETP